jgi:putative phosphoesterase
VHRSTRLELKSGRPLRLGLVADTHSQPHPNVVSLLEREQVDAILHGGDIGDLAVLDRLARVAPVIAVRGNIDTRATSVPDSVDITFSADDQDLLRVWLTHIAVTGPKLRADVARRAEAEGASIVVCGHSHVPFFGRDRGMTIFNPGSIGPRRFTLPITFGVMHVSRTDVKLWHVSCETGERWLP